MKAPLPSETVTVLSQSKEQIDNLFLLFYRYVWTWKDDWTIGGREKNMMMEIVEGKAGESSLAVPYLAAFLKRQQILLSALKDNGWKIPLDPIVLETDARLIAGLGYKGALEVGITLHPLYGFPYLPASSVKGVARAYAELVERPRLKYVVNDANDEKTRDAAQTQLDMHNHAVHLIFGSPEKKPDLAKEFRVGAVRFFDALPVEFPDLDVDVMTPHFGDYYMDKTGKTPPGDWLSPNPIPFLTVAEGQPFQFFLAARDAENGSKKLQAEECLALASEWLQKGLTDLGAGGKTTAGYGYFLSKEAREQQQRETAACFEKAEQERKEIIKKAQLEEQNRNRAAETIPEAGPRSRGLKAQVLRKEGRQLIVRLRAVGYEDDEVLMVGQFNPDGFQKDEWVVVDVEEFSRTTKRVTKLHYMKRDL